MILMETLPIKIHVNIEGGVKLPFYLQVVGYKNSGKTTMMLRLINYFCEKGKQVATLKHHGHGGMPVGWEKTDSVRQQHAGAMLSGVQGENVFQILGDEAWSLEKMLTFYATLPIDIVLIEGYKKEKKDKIVMISKKEEIALLDQLTHIKAVITTLPIKEKKYPFPIYHPDDWLLLARKLNEEWFS